MTDDLVPKCFEVAGDPLALGRGFDEDARRRPAGGHVVESLSVYAVKGEKVTPLSVRLSAS